MKALNRIGCISGWLLLAVFLFSAFKSDVLCTDSMLPSWISTSVQLLGSVAAICNVIWQVFKWYYERKEKVRKDRIEVLRRILLRYVGVSYFVGQICGRSMEANIDDVSVFVRINHLINNQLRKMIGEFVSNPLSESGIVEVFDRKVFDLCKQFETTCSKLVDESQSGDTNGFKINILNVKAKAYSACNTFDMLILRCSGLIGGDQDRIDALIRDVANEVI